ncbi:MAG: hypothetical protein QOG65_980 [Actinomycetota bacterium]|nr:hypothetical protein [Actinomycetota bacterium]
MRQQARGRVLTAGVTVIAVATALIPVGLAGRATAAPAPAPPATGAGTAALSRAGRGQKLSPRLAALASTPSAAPRASALSLPGSGVGSLVRRANGMVLVQIRTHDIASATIARLGAAGARVVNVSAAYSTVTADVAPASLRAVAADSSVAYVTEVLAPRVGSPGTTASDAVPGAVPQTATANAQCGSTTSEADTLMHAADARAAGNVDGAGTTVGILSDSYDSASGAATSASNDVASGDLPGPANPCGYPTPVTVQSESVGAGGADEGRAMAQLVHDLAPGAALAFASAFNGDLDFASQITKLRTTNHAKVIVDDVSYLNEPFFQNGPIANAANLSTASGVPYFSAAGNNNTIVSGANVSSYEAPTFRPVSCPPSVTALESVQSCHDFATGSGADNGDDISLAPGGGFGLDLQWAQPWGGITTDYDVFVLDATGAVVGGTNVDNLASKQPFEYFGYTNSTSSPQTVHLVIAKFSGAANPRLKFVFAGTGGITAVQYHTSTGGDVVGPSIFGHNGAENVGSTAAIPYSDASTPEIFSSRGPVTLYLADTPSVTALPSPRTLAKPDFAATDGVQTTFFAQPVGSVWRFYGTSAAAPQAAAVGALLEEYDPALSANQILAILHDTGRAVPTNGTAADVGGGYIDASAALASVVPKPGAPQNAFAVTGDTQATVSWTAPATNPNLPVTGYTVTPSIGGVPQPPQSFGSATTSATVTGLANGQTYTFQVTASNANGAGPASGATAAIVVGVPSAPAAPSAVPGSSSAVVTWTAPATNGSPITGYTVTPFWGTAPLSPQTFMSTATTQTVTGLSNGLTLTFRVAARNANGTGVESPGSGTVVVGAPVAPIDVRASPGNGAVAVYWAAPPSNNGAAVTGYAVTRFDAGIAQSTQTFASTATTQTLSGLVNGKTFQFKVAAVNSRGTGPLSAGTGGQVTIGAPKAVAPPTATPGNGAATVTWNAAVNNGFAVTQYLVTPFLDGVQQSGRLFASSVTTQSVTGLSNGASYTFTVAAGNANGSGPTSAVSARTIVGTPLTPTGISGTPGNASAVLHWTAPANNGAPLTGYAVTPYLAGVAQTVRTFASTATTQTVTGLVNAKIYTFRVAATNSRGTGPVSAASNAVTVGAPGAPTAVVATAGPKRATLHWKAPTVTNGAAVSGYIVVAYIGTVAQTFLSLNSTATTTTVDKLGTGKPYTFTVAARNSRGSGSASAKSNTIKPT